MKTFLQYVENYDYATPWDVVEDELEKYLNKYFNKNHHKKNTITWTITFESGNIDIQSCIAYKNGLFAIKNGSPTTKNEFAKNGFYELCELAKELNIGIVLTDPMSPSMKQILILENFKITGNFGGNVWEFPTQSPSYSIKPTIYQRLKHRTFF